MLQVLQPIVASRHEQESGTTTAKPVDLTTAARNIGFGQIVAEEVTEIIEMPDVQFGRCNCFHVQ